MASYGEGGYEGQKHHGSDDAYGNPVGQTDEYGNPSQHTTGGTEYGTTGGTEYGTTGAPAHGVGLSTGTGAHQLQRTSSSSSEDDGEGGRRKKSIKEKIKDKFPHKEEQQIHTTTPVSGESYGTSGEYGAPGTLEQPHEKKGLMEKIKDKLPGGHKEEQQTHTTTSPAVTGRSYGATDGEYGTNTTTPAVTGGSYGATGEYGTTAPGEQPYEKKGIMEKIKDKLPGAHN